MAPGQTGRQKQTVMQCTCHILAANNAGTISACLESALRPRIFARILVLLDTKTSDGTGKILQSYAARYPETIEVLTYEWSNPQDFSAARNACISVTQTPYAFWLDSDEVLNKPEQLRAMLNRANGQAFQMWVISPVGGGKFHNMFQPRLFPVTPGVRFECPVFERIDWSLNQAGIRMQRTGDEPIFHPGYVGAASLKKKNERNTRIMKKYLTEYRRNDEQRRHVATQYYRLTGQVL